MKTRRKQLTIAREKACKMILLRFDKSGSVGGRNLQDQRTERFKPALGSVQSIPYPGTTSEASSATPREMS